MDEVFVESKEETPLVVSLVFEDGEILDFPVDGELMKLAMDFVAPDPKADEDSKKAEPSHILCEIHWPDEFQAMDSWGNRLSTEVAVDRFSNFIRSVVVDYARKVIEDVEYGD